MPLRLLTWGTHTQDALDKPIPIGAVRAKTALPPQDRRSEGRFGRVHPEGTRSAQRRLRARTSRAPPRAPAALGTCLRARHTAATLPPGVHAPPLESAPSPLGASRDQSSLRGTGARGETPTGCGPRSPRPTRPGDRRDRPAPGSCGSGAPSTADARIRVPAA